MKTTDTGRPVDHLSRSLRRRLEDRDRELTADLARRGDERDRVRAALRGLGPARRGRRPRAAA